MQRPSACFTLSTTTATTRDVHIPDGRWRDKNAIKCSSVGRTGKKRNEVSPKPFSLSLTFAHGGRRNVVLVPEPVSLLEDLELLPQQAAKGGPHHRAGQGALREAADEEVDVADILVDAAQGLDDVRVDRVVELGEGGDRGETARGPDVGVGR